MNRDLWAVSVEHPEPDQLARALSSAAGESVIEAVTITSPEGLGRVLERRASMINRKLIALRTEVRSYPVIDQRLVDEIIGHDEHGLPA